MRCCWRTASHCGWLATSGRAHCCAMHCARAMKFRPAQVSCGEGTRTGSGAGAGGGAAASTAGAGAGGTFFTAGLRGLGLAAAVGFAAGAGSVGPPTSADAGADGAGAVVDAGMAAALAAPGVPAGAPPPSGTAADAGTGAEAAGPVISWLRFRCPHQPAAATSSAMPRPSTPIQRPLLTRARAGAGEGCSASPSAAACPAGTAACGAAATEEDSSAASPAAAATTCGQACAILRPQPLQNLAASRFSVLQLPQSTVTAGALSGNGYPLGLVHHALGNDRAQRQRHFQRQRRLPVRHLGKADGSHAPQLRRACGDDVGRARQP